MRSTILYVGDDPSIEKSLQPLIGRIGECCLEATADRHFARQRLRDDDLGMLLFHFAASAAEAEVAEFLSLAAKRSRALPVIVLSDRSDPALRLRFLKARALDCLARPIDFSRLSLLIDLTTASYRFARPAMATAKKPATNGASSLVDDFLCTTAQMRDIVQQVQRVAPLDTTVLLTGETGTGKTTLARLIHRWSPRRDKPLITVQCGALPPTLLESALFGHVRGAFTGADRDQVGRFTEAQDGTILVDEVDCMSLESQAKLLAAVEDRVFEPLGTVRTQPLRARLVFASNRRLEDEVAAGRFRSDLYYRLNVVGFALPRLHEQPAAIPPLAEKFLATYQAQTGREIHGFTPQAMTALQEHDWPGNVRELRNVVERAVVFCSRPEIGLEDLPDTVRNKMRNGADVAVQTAVAGTNQLAHARASAEINRLQEALQRNKNNRTQTAAELGVSRMTLFKKLRRYGLG
jgi:two-component system response regulator HydG